MLTNWSDGHNHLYLYSYDQANPETATAKLERQLTRGDFEVGEVLARRSCGQDDRLRLERGQSAGAADVAGELCRRAQAAERGRGLPWRQLCAGGRRICRQALGAHGSADGAAVRRTPGKCRVFWQTRALEAYRLRAPEQLEVKAHDGTTLYATLLLPEGRDECGQRAADRESLWRARRRRRWPTGGTTALLFDELLAQHGFAVLHADNRGMGMRGRAFAQAAYHNFGPVQLEDQLTVVDAALAKYPQLDPKRLGWWGWSWGGTFTLYALTHSDRFRAGVAVAPVTDWQNYDSIYTERYMSEPAEFADGYKEFSVVNSAAQLKGRLLLVHGTGDDNVHMENTVQFVQKLIEAGIPYDLQIYPRKTHSIAGADVRTHLYNRILAQFEQYLKPPGAASEPRNDKNTGQQRARLGRSRNQRLVTMKEIVFFAVGAVGAFQAADQEHGHSHRHQDSQNARIDRKPMHQTFILIAPFLTQLPICRITSL